MRKRPKSDWNKTCRVVVLDALPAHKREAGYGPSPGYIGVPIRRNVCSGAGLVRIGLFRCRSDCALRELIDPLRARARRIFHLRTCPLKAVTALSRNVAESRPPSISARCKMNLATVARLVSSLGPIPMAAVVSWKALVILATKAGSRGRKVSCKWHPVLHAPPMSTAQDLRRLAGLSMESSRLPSSGRTYCRDNCARAP